MSSQSTDRRRKFRQAAFVYLHVGILYEAGVWSLRGTGLLPADRGPIWLWLLMGAAIVAVVFWGLWSWRNAWFARAVWALHALRLPALLEGAFLGNASAGSAAAPSSGAGAAATAGAGAEALPPSAYLVALVVVLVNLAFLARAGWDL